MGDGNIKKLVNTAITSTVCVRSTWMSFAENEVNIFTKQICFKEQDTYAILKAQSKLRAKFVECAICNVQERNFPLSRNS